MLRYLVGFWCRRSQWMSSRLCSVQAGRLSMTYASSRAGMTSGLDVMNISDFGICIVVAASPSAAAHTSTPPYQVRQTRGWGDGRMVRKR